MGSNGVLLVCVKLWSQFNIGLSLNIFCSLLIFSFFEGNLSRAGLGGLFDLPRKFTNRLFCRAHFSA